MELKTDDTMRMINEHNRRVKKQEEREELARYASAEMNRLTSEIVSKKEKKKKVVKVAAIAACSIALTLAAKFGTEQFIGSKYYGKQVKEVIDDTGLDCNQYSDGWVFNDKDGNFYKFGDAIKKLEVSALSRGLSTDEFVVGMANYFGGEMHVENDISGSSPTFVEKISIRQKGYYKSMLENEKGVVK